ncbi:unnamed protein product [Prunus armeniaca]
MVAFDYISVFDSCPMSLRDIRTVQSEECGSVRWALWSFVLGTRQVSDTHRVRLRFQSGIWVESCHKFSAKLPHSAYKEYWLDFHKTICDIDNKDEFDAKWNIVVTKSGLIDHPWLSLVLDLRESWVPAYV